MDLCALGRIMFYDGRHGKARLKEPKPFTLYLEEILL
jgi:hypothetical protein